MSGHSPIQLKPAVPPNKLLRYAVKSAIQMIRYWWVVSAALAVSLTAGIMLSKLSSETTWTVEAGIVYGRLPIDGAAERLYVPPDLRTVSSLVKSAAVLDSAIEKGGLDYSTHGLSSSLSVEEPRGTQKIGLSIVTTDVDKGAHILGSIILAFQDHVAGLRRSLISRNLGDLQQSQARNESRMSNIRARLAEFAGVHQVNDVDAEVQSLITNESSMAYQLNSQKIEEQGLRVQRISVQQQLDQQKEEEELESQSEKEAEAAEESLADNRRRQDRLNELIREERRLNEIRAKLDAKQSEYNRKLILFEKGFISKNDFEAINAEVEALKAQILEGKKIDEWKTELERIDKMVVPKAKSKRVGSPIVHQTMFKLVELDLHILASQESQRQLGLVIAESRQRLSQLELYKTEQAGLLAEMKSVSDERDSLNNQISALQALHEMGPVEFSVAQPPSSNMKPPSSNRKKMFVMIFGGIAAMLISPILLLAVATATRPSLLEYCEQLGMAVISPQKTLMELFRDMTPDDIAVESVNWCRHMSLRMQQLQPRSGAVITFLPCSKANHDTDTRLLIRIAETLARRDENVLVVSLMGSSLNPVASDECVKPDSQTLRNPLQKLELFDFISDSAVEFEYLLNEHKDRIHFVTGGKYDPEQLFSKRMAEFFEHARKNYSMIVVLGPFLGEQTDAEMIARYSDGLLLLHDRNDGLTNGMQRTIESLCELQAPIWGLATRVGITRKPRIRFSFGLKSSKKGDEAKLSQDKSEEVMTAEKNDILTPLNAITPSENSKTTI